MKKKMMKIKSDVCSQMSRALCCSLLIAAAVLSAPIVSAQDASSIDKLEEQLEQQRLALQEAIADREATFFRAQDVESQLSEAQETQRQIEEEVKMLCEEQEALKPGTLDECMSSSE